MRLHGQHKSPAPKRDLLDEIESEIDDTPSDDAIAFNLFPENSSADGGNSMETGN